MINKKYEKYKEIISYLFFGASTTAVNWLCYTLCLKGCDVSITVSNIIAWFFSVIFAYITNKIFVFNNREWVLKKLAKEIGLFFSARILSGIIEMVGVPFLVWCGLDQSVFGIEGMCAKISISFIVIISNYVFSKLFVFKNKKQTESAHT
jgi:putative flippase GtrA